MTMQRVFPSRAVASGVAALCGLCAGCAALRNSPLQALLAPNVETEVKPVVNAVAALSAQVQDVQTKVGDVRAQQSAIDQHVENFDTRTLRIIALAPWLFGAFLVIGILAYLIAKGIWHGAGAATRSIRKQSAGVNEPANGKV